MIYEVYTNLDTDELSEVGLETYRKWLAFALGVETIGGKKLKNPSGKYAESIHMERRSPYLVSIFTDEKSAEMIEDGRPSYNLRTKMLARGARTGADGSRYRYIPIASMHDPETEDHPFPNSISPAEGAAYLSKIMSGGSGAVRVGTLWGKAYRPEDIRTMSSNQPYYRWQIPAFRAYSPAKTLADLLDQRSTPAGAPF
ncbi:MAG: hypothetical protein ACYCOU_15280 [Sulfobacillus sp.]